MRPSVPVCVLLLIAAQHRLNYKPAASKVTDVNLTLCGLLSIRGCGVSSSILSKSYR